MLLDLIWTRKRLDIQEFRVYACKKYEGQENFINKNLMRFALMKSYWLRR